MSKSTPRTPSDKGRRQFLKWSACLIGTTVAGGFKPGGMRQFDSYQQPSRRMSIEIADTTSDFEREPLGRPFGFKGGFMSNVWQTVAKMQSTSGTQAIGLGTQNVLWSDADVFTAHSESGGNALMYAITERALQLADGMSFETPVDLLERLFEPVLEYGREITGQPQLSPTFALNALVAVDNAAWLLYAREHGIDDFDELVPQEYQKGLPARHDRVASVPAFGYASTAQDLRSAAQDGYYIMKIKIGHPGTQEEMLEQDKQWLSTIHDVLGSQNTPHTESGNVPYYLDANGRYEEKETLERLLDHARDIGAFDRILVLEEPFPEDRTYRVDDLGVNVAADESAHTPEDVVERIQMGYGSIALKPIAKTLTMTLKMANRAQERGTPCFCADLTVNPILVDWNKNIAARLPALPGINTGLMETNGHQNYANWSQMESYHPCEEAPWRQANNGVFEVGDDFYQRSGCIFQTSDHYENLVEAPDTG